MPPRGSPAATGDVPDWQRRIRDQIGEDPARYLDKDLLEPPLMRTETVRRNHHDEVRLIPDRDVAPEGIMAIARIRGIDKLERVRAWQAVERRLGRGSDGGPREFIMDALDEREQTLLEIGDRSDRIESGDTQ